VLFASGVVVHASLTLMGLFSYVETAMKISHGEVAGPFTGQLQYLRSLFLWPVLLKLFKERPDMLTGGRGVLLLLFNSFLWIFALAWLYLLLRRVIGGRVHAAGRAR